MIHQCSTIHWYRCLVQQTTNTKDLVLPESWNLKMITLRLKTGIKYISVQFPTERCFRKFLRLCLTAFLVKSNV